MLNTQLDFAQHIFKNIDAEWFPEPTWDDAPVVPQSEQVAPNIKAIMRMLAAGWAADAPSLSGIGYQDQYNYTKAQSRIATATGFWLDYAASDYFGSVITRHIGETDFNFRKRLITSLLVDHGTRCAVICNLTNLTGYTPKIVELMSTQDCGAYSQIGQTYQKATAPDVNTNIAYYPPIALGTADGSVAGAGAYGTTGMPFQFFVKAYRKLSAGIPNVNGYSGMLSGYATLAKGFGYVSGTRPIDMGYGQYCALDELGGSITDQDIYDMVARSTAAGVTAWTNISDYVSSTMPYSGGMLGINFFLGNSVLVDPFVQLGALNACISILHISSTGYGYQPSLTATYLTPVNITSVATLDNPTKAVGYITLPIELDGSIDIDQLHAKPNIAIQIVASLYSHNYILSAIPIKITTRIGLESEYPMTTGLAQPVKIGLFSHMVSQPVQINVLVITSRFHLPTTDLLGTFLIGEGVLGVAGGLLGISWQMGYSELGTNYGY